MLFSRSEVRGIPQNSVIMTSSSTTLARVSAASPVISLDPTLRHGRGHTRQGCVEGYGNGFAMCTRDCKGWVGAMRADACQRGGKHFGGSGALEIGDLRLLEDGGECSGALSSNAVVSETASEGQDVKW